MSRTFFILHRGSTVNLVLVHISYYNTPIYRETLFQFLQFTEKYQTPLLDAVLKPCWGAQHAFQRGSAHLVLARLKKDFICRSEPTGKRSGTPQHSMASKIGLTEYLTLTLHRIYHISEVKLCSELGLESLWLRRWFWRFAHFYKTEAATGVVGLRPASLLKKEALAQMFPCEFCETFKSILFTEQPLATASDKIQLSGFLKCLFDLILSSRHSYVTDTIKIDSLPYVINDWKTLTSKFHSCKTFLYFKNELIKLEDPLPNLLLIHIICLCLCLNHLNALIVTLELPSQMI